MWLPLAGGVFRLSFVSGSLLLLADSEATGTESAWVDHIQVAQASGGKSAAVESSRSESRVATGVCGVKKIKFKFTVKVEPVPLRLLVSDQVRVWCASRAAYSLAYTVLAGAHE